MSEKNPGELKDEIGRLKEMKPSVRRMTMFGDDNHSAIEAQIAVLTKRMTDDDIYDRWPEDDGPDAYARSSAQDAAAWMRGEEADAELPSSTWESLRTAK